jgi:AraC-like DNA-binding protein
MSSTILLLRLTTALLATLLFCGIAAHARRQRSFGVTCLALWTGVLAASAWQTVLMITPAGYLTPLGRLLAGLVLTLGPPLLLGYVTWSVRGMRLHRAWLLPFATYATAALVLGTGLNARLSMLVPLVLSWAYTVVGWVVWFRHARPRSGQPVVIAVLAAVTAAQLGQVLGVLDLLGYVDYRPLRQASLVIISAWLAIALVMALTDSPLFRKLAPALAPPVSDADRALFARIERLMQETRPWCDPDFDVGALARLLGTYPNAVSKALGRAGGTTFYDYVNAYRVREAQRLLTDPTESRFKVEALGRQAGFRARSTFFKLFRQHTGVSPAEYRATHATGRSA